MNSVNVAISYLLHCDNDNEELIRQDLKMRCYADQGSKVRCFDSEQIEKLIEAARKVRKDNYKLGRMLANIGIPTDLGVSDMLTYALVADNKIDAIAYLEATKNQDSESIETIASTLARAGLPDAKCIGRVINNLRGTAYKANRRRKDKRARKAAPHRDPESDIRSADEVLDSVGLLDFD